MVKQERQTIPGEGLTHKADKLLMELRPVTIDTFPSAEWFCRADDLILVMQSAAQRQKLDADGARHLLVLSRMSAEFDDSDILYNSIQVLSGNNTTARPLLEFAERELNQQRFTDWRWIGFYAVSAVLANDRLSEEARTVSRDLVELLWQEAPRERDVRRRGQLIEIAGQAEKTLQSQTNQLPQNS